MNLTPKQEAFCQAYLETGNASEAYRIAYNVKENTKDTTISPKASKLLKEYKISTRVKELQNQLEERHNVTKDQLVEEYLDIIRTHKKLRGFFNGKNIKAADMKKLYAMSNSGFIRGSDVTAAISGLAKLLGYDKQETTINIQNNFVTKWADGDNPV